MKKLSVILAALCMSTGFIFAQHIDVVNQTGNDNSSLVNQGFMGSGAVLPGNEAYVDQIGDKNVASVDQFNNGYGGSEHLASVYSKGDKNTGIVYQENDGGDALIHQKGDKNWADIFQTGNFNKGAPMNTEYNAFAKQVGDMNIIEIDIWGTNSTAYGLQEGNMNSINQDLGSDYGMKVQNSDFDARQKGNKNTAVQLLEGDGFAGGILALDNYGTIHQIGDANTAIQIMSKDGTISAAFNYAEAYQKGNGNWSEQNQAGAGNSSIHSQIGNNNVEVTNQN